jgi:transketolase
MPSTNLFDMQSAAYREEVLPKGISYWNGNINWLV